MDENRQLAALYEFFQAIGQPERLKIVGLLAEQPQTMGDLATALDMKETAVARHIKQLEASGLVSSHMRQFTVSYALNPDALNRYQQIILADETSPKQAGGGDG